MEAMFGVLDFQQAEISPDGKRVAWVESLPGAGGAPSSNSAIYVADLSASATKKRITAGDGKAPHEEHDIAWSTDSKQLAFLSDAPKTGQLQLFIIPVSGAPAAKGPATHKSASKQEASAAKQLTHVKGFLAGPGWSPDSKTIALLFTENATRAAGPLVAETPDEGVVSEDFLEQRLTLVDVATASLRQISPADTYVYEFDWSPDGKQLVITSAKGNGDDNWYIASLSAIDATSGEMRDVQPKPGMQIANPRWSPDGKTIILFEPNPRGSYGMGEKFTQANVKDFGYGDFLDIMAGVDKTIEQAPVDPSRLGITGWSYGGFMTMWAVTQTNRFGAAVAGAGLSNYLSYYGENKIDQWMIPYFGATAYDDPVVYAKSSPINFIKKAKTPTLVVVGDRDGECPAPQSYEFWHALKTLKVPTEFVIYPNEGHLFANPEHSRDVIDRTAAWFGQYLGGAK